MHARARQCLVFLVFSLRLRDAWFPLLPALARRRFRFACLPVRGNAWLFRFILRLRVPFFLFRQNGMEVSLSLIQGETIMANASMPYSAKFCSNVSALCNETMENPQVQSSSNSPPPFRLAILPSRERDRLTENHVVSRMRPHCPAKRNPRPARAWINGRKPFPKTTLFPDRDRVVRPNGTPCPQGHGLTRKKPFRKSRCYQNETALSGQTEPQTRKVYLEN